jgi:regulator of protease activity HflC (stomatin/prohibitin superfamily)
MNIAIVINAIAGLSWFLVIGLVVVVVVRATRGRSIRGALPILIASVVLAIVLNVISAGLVFIQPNERGVVITVGKGGVRPDPLQPGLRWVIPFAENVIPYSISRQTYTMSIAPQEGQIQGDDSVLARTSDGQVIFVDSSVIFAINPTQVVDVHIKWQKTYVDGLIRPLARGIIRDAVSGYGVEEVYSTRRMELTQQISGELERKLAAEGFTLVDFVLRNISFSDEYAASVEQKQIAEQQAQQAKFVVEQRKQEAEQARQVAQGKADASAIEAEGEARALKIRAQAEAEARLIKAKAEAEALRMLATAVRENPDVLTLEYIQKLAPNISVMLLPSGNPFLFTLPDWNAPADLNQPLSIPTPTAPMTTTTPTSP